MISIHLPLCVDMPILNLMTGGCDNWMPSIWRYKPIKELLIAYYVGYGISAHSCIWKAKLITFPYCVLKVPWITSECDFVIPAPAEAVITDPEYCGVHSSCMMDCSEDTPYKGDKPTGRPQPTESCSFDVLAKGKQSSHIFGSITLKLVRNIGGIKCQISPGESQGISSQWLLLDMFVVLHIGPGNLPSSVSWRTW